MVRSYMKAKKKRKEIERLKEELNQNKDTYKKNIEMLRQKAELLEALEKDFKYDERRFNTHLKIVGIELSNHKVVTPLMKFHNMPEWETAFKELKELEKDSIEKDWELAQKNFKNQTKRTNSMINEKDIQEQQDRIEARNPEIVESLKNYGVDLKEEKVDYIG